MSRKQLSESAKGIILELVDDQFEINRAISGLEDGEVTDHLVTEGYDEEDIDEAYDFLEEAIALNVNSVLHDGDTESHRFPNTDCTAYDLNRVCSLLPKSEAEFIIEICEKAADSKTLSDSYTSDPSIVCHFADASILYIDNPKQDVHPIRVVSFNGEW